MSAPAPRVLERGLGEEREGPLVADSTPLEHPAVAVRGVLAEADVRRDDEGGEVALELPYRPRDDAIAENRPRCRLVLGPWEPEEQHRLYPLVEEPPDLARHGVDRIAKDPGIISTGSRTFSPSLTNRGATRSEACTWFSVRRLLIDSVRLRRRSLVASTPAIFFDSAVGWSSPSAFSSALLPLLFLLHLSRAPPRHRAP